MVYNRDIPVGVVFVYDHVARHRLIVRAVGMCYQIGVVTSSRQSVEPLGTRVSLLTVVRGGNGQPCRPALCDIQPVDEFNTDPSKAVLRRVGAEVIDLAIWIACIICKHVCAVGTDSDTMTAEPAASLNQHLTTGCACHCCNFHHQSCRYSKELSHYHQSE